MTPLNILCLNNTLPRKLLTVLTEEEDFKVINNLEYFSQIEDICPAQKIDVLLVVIEDQQDMSVIESLIKNKSAKNVVAVGNTNSEIIFECIKTGIRGFICQDISPDLLKKAIRVINKGEIWFDRKNSSKMFEEFAKHITTKGQPELAESLSKREKEVLGLISHGYKNKHIAENLCISMSTVKTHLSKIYDKIGVEDRLDAVIFARKINNQQKQKIIL